MKVKVIAKSKKYASYAKMIEKVMNSDKELTMTTEIASDIALKLIIWEMLMGKKALIDILKEYYKS